ncbi:MAG: hypothetical protein IJM68_04925 [Synergistaceae bacterium]|nr:hypothetical protein [Synergistaceae bacterium]
MSDTVKTVLIDGGSPVALSDEEARFVYNLLPVGEFYDKRYGRVSITAEKIHQMAENFGKCPAYEVPVKLGHDDGAKSTGKVIGVEAKPDGLEITMLVDAETAQAINAKHYRYMSAEFDEDYHDKKTGQNVGAVLLGAALVNQPAHPYVAPLVLADDINTQPEERNDNTMNETEDLRLQLSDIKAQKAQADAELKAVREQSEATAKKLADLEAANKALTEERERMEAARNEAEVKIFCDTWTVQGIPPAVVNKVKPLLSRNSPGQSGSVMTRKMKCPH